MFVIVTVCYKDKQKRTKTHAWGTLRCTHSQNAFDVWAIFAFEHVHMQIFHSKTFRIDYSYLNISVLSYRYNKRLQFCRRIEFIFNINFKHLTGHGLSEKKEFNKLYSQNVQYTIWHIFFLLSQLYVYLQGRKTYYLSLLIISCRL